MKRILPSSDWLLSGQDGSLLPAQYFSVCFHKWISNVISSLIWIIRIYFRRKIVKHTVHRLRAASLFLQLLVRSVHSRQSVERRTRSVVTEGGKALSCLARFARQTKKERLLVVYTGIYVENSSICVHVMETRVKQHPTVTQYYVITSCVMAFPL